MLECSRTLYLEVSGAKRKEMSAFLGLAWRTRRRFKGLHLGCVDGAHDVRTSWGVGIWRLLADCNELAELSVKLNGARVERRFDLHLLPPQVARHHFECAGQRRVA